MVRPRVIARLMGGIGNQMFIYAAARRLAQVNGAELVLDARSGFERDSYGRHYQLGGLPVAGRLASAGERLEPFGRLRRALLRQRTRCLPFEATHYLREVGMAFDARVLTRKVHGTLFMEGYWQSHRYFDDIAPAVRSELTPPAPTDERNRACMEAIARSDAIAVHVRFFDSPGAATGNNASAAYFCAAVARMQGARPGARFFLFSDRPAEARAMLDLPDEKIVVVDHNQGDQGALADLGLMTRCRHFVIANSTFSWWGAWLSQTAPDKCVIAPGFVKRDGLSAWGFDGLLPREWVTL